MGYTDVDPDDPGETWAPPGREPLVDGDQHPLTWARVRQAHEVLVRHASCGGEGSEADPSGYDSGDEDTPCPCLWHEMMIDELRSHRAACAAWPGPICGACWAASCACGFVFDDAADAAGRDAVGRLVCASPACASRLA